MKDVMELLQRSLLPNGQIETDSVAFLDCFNAAFVDTLSLPELWVPPSLAASTVKGIASEFVYIPVSARLYSGYSCATTLALTINELRHGRARDEAIAFISHIVTELAIGNITNAEAAMVLIDHYCTLTTIHGSDGMANLH